MATKYEGTKRLGFAIHPTGNKPLDDRMVVDHKSDLTSGSTFDGAHYDGMIVAVVEDKKAYMLVDSNNITADTSWVCLGSNSNINIDDATISGVVNNILSEGKYINEETLAEELAKIEIPITGVTYSGVSLNIENKNVDLSQYFYDKSNIDTLISGVTGQIENIEEQISNFELFELVTSLPVENVNTNKIYVIPSDPGGVNNVYIEYIYVNGNWEKIGEVTTDVNIKLTDYYTTGQTYSKDEVYNKTETYSKDEVYTTGQTYNKSEVDRQLNTKTITLSEDIKDNEDDDEPVYYSGRTVQEILKDLSLRIKNINAGGTSAAVNIVSGTAINITEEDDSTKISVIVSKDEDNAISVSENDGGLYVESLKARVEELEKLLENVITVNNIGNYAVTSISYANSTDDIKINGTTGAVTLELDSITNIAYGDAEPINEVE